MQPPAVPDLAHTHARPVHWLATATAMAGVVALAGLLQPGPAGATAAPAPRPAPDAATARFPLECRGAPSTIAQRATGDLDGDGNPETVAVVHCEAGSGTPPSGIYVLTHGTAAGTPAARVVATLVEPSELKNVTAFAVRDGAVHATLLGYSSPDVPSCCPDEHEQVTWRWKGGVFLRTAKNEARAV
ncbi:hypothetical protein [Streptomyces showdoensis]|uniref:Secreted protein n=1 Tax=Streptomyces showdoensis TaxID=68268 RepID=A0A2P2GGV2_STREW|nr:hypothetical protein [Streptomyces showdoensis]KKZ70740.1 hypothetical protein VO63_27130 [Streptomyces showdoensis]